MSAVTRNHGPGQGAFTALLFAAAVFFGAVVMPTIAGWINTGEPEPINPAGLIFREEPWTPAHTAVSVVLGVVILAAAVLVLVREARRERAPHDRAAPYMGQGRAIAPLMPAQLRKKHQRLGLDPKIYLGVLLGYAIQNDIPLRASFEDTITVVAGPRRNKSVSIVIPNVLAAPGTVLTTSVKPDVLAATIGYRSTIGDVHVFDPQGLAAAHDEYRCWWNPLAGIRTVEDAAILASVLTASAYPGDGGEQDRFFPEEGKKLLTDYLFAAAVDGRYLPAVLDWLSTENDREPVRILRDAHPRVADRIEATQAVTERTRSGIFTYARGAVAFLASDAIRAWVQPGDGRRSFDPVAFAAAPAETLYLLSEEGAGSAGPLIAALTRAVLTAAEEDAKRQPTGRREKPLLAILDEAGNICRIPDLPQRYTHYGSRGIIVVTILQSQEQGEQVWGAAGFGQLWAASTVQVFGGGNASNTFLRNLSERIGDYEYTERSTSSQKGGRTVQNNRRSERIMDVSDLGSLALGRMVVLASGCRPTLVRSVGYFKDKKLRALAEMRPSQVHHTAQLEVEDAA